MAEEEAKKSEPQTEPCSEASAAPALSAEPVEPPKDAGQEKTVIPPPPPEEKIEPAAAGEKKTEWSIDRGEPGDKKAKYIKIMKNRVALVHKAAEEKKAIIEARRGEDLLKADKTAAKYRETGTAPKKLLGWF